MTYEQLAGLFFIFGFISYLAAAFTAPRLYQESDISVREEILANNRGRWIVSQLFFALAILFPAFGFLLLSIYLWGDANALLLSVGAVAITVGGVLGILFVTKQTTDPVRYWSETRPSPLLSRYLVLTLAAGILYGIVLVQESYPVWLGWLILGYSVIAAFAFVLFKVPVFWLASLFNIVSLVVGIVLLTQ
jgi:hypothetical protein